MEKVKHHLQRSDIHLTLPAVSVAALLQKAASTIEFDASVRHMCIVTCAVSATLSLLSVLVASKVSATLSLLSCSRSGSSSGGSTGSTGSSRGEHQ